MELEFSACLLKLSGLLKFDIPGWKARFFNWNSHMRTLIMCLVYALGIVDALKVENVTLINTLIASQRAMASTLIMSYFFNFYKKQSKVKKILRLFETFPKFSDEKTNSKAERAVAEAKKMTRRKTLTYFLIQFPFPLFYTYSEITELFAKIKLSDGNQAPWAALGYWWFIIKPWEQIFFSLLTSFAFWHFTIVLSSADSFINCAIISASERTKFLAETVTAALKPAPNSTNLTNELREWLRYHRHTRKLVELISCTFAMQLSLIIFYYISNISIMVYFFVLNPDLTVMIFLVFYLIQPYFYCRAGEKLTSESSMLAENVRREVLRQIITGELKHGTMTNAIEDLIDDCGPKNYHSVQPIGFGALSKVLFAKLLYTSNYWFFALLQWKPINPGR